MAMGMAIAGIASMAATAVGGIYGAYAQNEAAKEQAELAKRQAEAQAAALQRQAEEHVRQTASKNLEAANYQKQAGEELRAAAVEDQKAIIEQQKGEREAARRSMLLAQEIGSQYANYAANGFLVDSGSGTDTFASILKSTATEGAADISAIQEESEMNRWSFEERARALRVGAGNTLASANASKMQAENLMFSAQNAREAASDTLKNGYAAASAYKKQGKRALRGGILSAGASTVHTGLTYANNGTFDYFKS